jgi:hypothetical protein
MGRSTRPKQAKNKSRHLKRLEPSLTAFRSAITTGKNLFVGVDERTAYARRFRDVFAAHLGDLGGADNISEAERSLIRRATTLTVALERLESKFAEQDGEASTTDLMLYQRVSGALRRILQTLGLERRQKDVTSLGELLRRDHVRQMAEEAELT